MLFVKKCSPEGGRFYKLLNKDVGEFNKVYLSLFSVLFIFLCGVISYFVTNSYAMFTNEIVGDKSIDVIVCIDSVIPKSSTNDVNAPVLSGNMIPVYYDECMEVWKKADATNNSYVYRWYNYDEKIWANSVTVSGATRNMYKNAALGTEVKMEDILTMQVWIPRYKYKVWNYNLDGTVNSNPKEIEITFESGTNSSGEIECVDSISDINGSVSEMCNVNGVSCTDGLCNGKTYTHPAFTFGEDELTGFWVGKFELSNPNSCTPADNSAVGSGCNLQTVKPLVLPNKTSWRGAMIGTYDYVIRGMNDSNNLYGFSDFDDIHMIKNSEWGAITYLSHSKYGKNEEVEANRNTEYKTGCGPILLGSTASGECNSYETILGQSASITGNIYGVYDMSGGSYEYVMGNTVYPGDVTKKYTGEDDSSNKYSGFTGMLATGSSIIGSYEYPDEKYYDLYNYVSPKANVVASKLGDAIKEVAMNSASSRSWYNDYLYMIGGGHPWGKRGGSYSLGENAGIFTSDHSGGASRASYSTRFIIGMIE